MRPVARKLGFQNLQLTQTVGELRVFRRGGRVGNRRVETSKNLFEGVIVAFTVAAGEIRVGASAFHQQRVADFERDGPDSLEETFFRATQQPDFAPLAREILDAISGG